MQMAGELLCSIFRMAPVTVKIDLVLGPLKISQLRSWSSINFIILCKRDVSAIEAWLFSPASGSQICHAIFISVMRSIPCNPGRH